MKSTSNNPKENPHITRDKWLRDRLYHFTAYTPLDNPRAMRGYADYFAINGLFVQRYEATQDVYKNVPELKKGDLLQEIATLIHAGREGEAVETGRAVLAILRGEIGGQHHAAA